MTDQPSTQEGENVDRCETCGREARTSDHDCFENVEGVVTAKVAKALDDQEPASRGTDANRPATSASPPSPSTTQEAEKALEDAWELVKEQVEFSWHGNGCATNVGPEDGGGYCTPNCRQYQALAALRSLRTQLDRAQALENKATHRLAEYRRDVERELDSRDARHTKDQERIEELETALQRIRDWDENGKVFTGIHASAAVQIAYDALYTPTYPKEGGE